MSEYIFDSVSIDTEIPTVGDFTYVSGTPSSVTLLLGSPSTDINFHRYRLFYRAGLVEPSESDLEHTEAFFDHIDYDGETQVTVTGLDISERYTLILYVYDTFGNSGKNNTIVKGYIIGVNGLFSGATILGEPITKRVYPVAPVNLLSGYPLQGTPITKRVYPVVPVNLLSGYPLQGTPVVVITYLLVLVDLITQALYLGKPRALLRADFRNLSSSVMGSLLLPQLYVKYQRETIVGTMRVPILFGRVNTDHSWLR